MEAPQRRVDIHLCPCLSTGPMRIRIDEWPLRREHMYGRWRIADGNSQACVRVRETCMRCESIYGTRVAERGK